MPLTTTRIAIRSLRASDYKTIRQIQRADMGEYVRYLRETDDKDSVEPSVKPQYFEHYLKFGTSFVAEIGGEIVGYILSQPTSFVQSHKKGLWLEYITVVQQHRRKGIGSRLLTKATSWAHAHNCKLLYTSLNPNNPASEGLLKKNGFEVKDWKTAHRVLK